MSDDSTPRNYRNCAVKRVKKPSTKRHSKKKKSNKLPLNELKVSSKKLCRGRVTVPNQGGIYLKGVRSNFVLRPPLNDENTARRDENLCRLIDFGFPKQRQTTGDEDGVLQTLCLDRTVNKAEGEEDRRCSNLPQQRQHRPRASYRRLHVTSGSQEAADSLRRPQRRHCSDDDAVEDAHYQQQSCANVRNHQGRRTTVDQYRPHENRPNEINPDYIASSSPSPIPQRYLPSPETLQERKRNFHKSHHQQPTHTVTNDRGSGPLHNVANRESNVAEIRRFRISEALQAKPHTHTISHHSEVRYSGANEQNVLERTSIMMRNEENVPEFLHYSKKTSKQNVREYHSEPRYRHRRDEENILDHRSKMFRNEHVSRKHRHSEAFRIEQNVSEYEHNQKSSRMFGNEQHVVENVRESYSEPRYSNRSSDILRNEQYNKEDIENYEGAGNNYWKSLERPSIPISPILYNRESNIVSNVYSSPDGPFIGESPDLSNQSRENRELDSSFEDDNYRGENLQRDTELFRPPAEPVRKHKSCPRQQPFAPSSYSTPKPAVETPVEDKYLEFQEALDNIFGQIVGTISQENYLDERAMLCTYYMKRLRLMQDSGGQESTAVSQPNDVGGSCHEGCCTNADSEEYSRQQQYTCSPRRRRSSSRRMTRKFAYEDCMEVPWREDGYRGVPMASLQPPTPCNTFRYGVKNRSMKQKDFLW